MGRSCPWASPMSGGVLDAVRPELTADDAVGPGNPTPRLSSN